MALEVPTQGSPQHKSAIKQAFKGAERGRIHSDRGRWYGLPDITLPPSLAAPPGMTPSKVYCVVYDVLC